jgi:hypothetical protein
MLTQRRSHSVNQKTLCQVGLDNELIPSYPFLPLGCHVISGPFQLTAILTGLFRTLLCALQTILKGVTGQIG